MNLAPSAMAMAVLMATAAGNSGSDLDAALSASDIAALRAIAENDADVVLARG